MGGSKYLWRTLDILHVIDWSFPLRGNHIQEIGQVQVEILIQIQIVEANDTGSIIIVHDIFVLVVVVIWAREHIVMFAVLWWGNLLNLRVRHVRGRDSRSIG